jgi:UDP-N-acetylmuramoylalanine--D-glutamate ligase
VIGDIELFAQAPRRVCRRTTLSAYRHQQQSTTTALIHHILAAAGIPTTMGGNIGLPILAQARCQPVASMFSNSSYSSTSRSASIAMSPCNVTPDHLERHGSLAAYAAAKTTCSPCSRLAAQRCRCAGRSRFR